MRSRKSVVIEWGSSWLCSTLFESFRQAFLDFTGLTPLCPVYESDEELFDEAATTSPTTGKENANHDYISASETSDDEYDCN